MASCLFDLGESCRDFKRSYPDPLDEAVIVCRVCGTPMHPKDRPNVHIQGQGFIGTVSIDGDAWPPIKLADLGRWKIDFAKFNEKGPSKIPPRTMRPETSPMGQTWGTYAGTLIVPAPARGWEKDRSYFVLDTTDLTHAEIEYWIDAIHSWPDPLWHGPTPGLAADPLRNPSDACLRDYHPEGLTYPKVGRYNPGATSVVCDRPKDHTGPCRCTRRFVPAWFELHGDTVTLTYQYKRKVR